MGIARYSLAVASLILLGLASCEANRTVQVQNNVTQIAVPAQPRPRPTPPHFMTKTVASGVRSTVFFSLTMNRDCSSPGLGSIQIRQQPSHGLAEVVTEGEHVSAPPSNPFAACDGRVIPALKVKYASATGFTGTDSLSILVTTARGDVSKMDLFITVD